MIGYLAASPQLLTEEELSRYKGAYCGLCRTLGERWGLLSRLTLNYDMTFLILLLNALYEPEEEAGTGGCLMHPVKARSWWRSEITAYAADMNVALSYLNLRDDWKDDRKPAALAASALLENAYRRITDTYPRQCEAMEREIRALTELENAGRPDPDGTSLCFGRLLGEVFIYRDDRWKNLLYNTGCGLGRFIYLLDAVTDLEEDRKKHRYNPFSDREDGPETEQQYRDILKLFLGDAVAAFQALPLVQDTGLMRNILCVGLWQAFERKYHPPEKTDDRQATGGNQAQTTDGNQEQTTGGN